MVQTIARISYILYTSKEGYNIYEHMKKFPTMFISGDPKPKGSWTGVPTKTGIKFRPANPKWAKWFKRIKDEIERCWKGPLLAGPVKVDLLFFLPRPKTVKRAYPTSKYDGDGDKLERAVWDGMTGTVYEDDGQVVRWSGKKEYAEGDTGVRITVSAL